MGLFSAYYWREFCVSKRFGRDNKNSLKHKDNRLQQFKTANHNSSWAYIHEGLLSEGFLRLRLGWLIFGTAFFWRGLLSEFYGMSRIELFYVRNFLKTAKIGKESQIKSPEGLNTRIAIFSNSRNCCNFRKMHSSR